ncbi:MAG TPA: amidohydrolase family protein [Cyclobacteriaceae bacterium]|nr:amidohydrolase family protein [Cyclobacteriaceae bacterium]
MRQLLVLLVLILPLLTAAQPVEYDLVFSGGQVYDPETKLNKILNVGINGGKIAKLSESSLKGKREINIRNLVLCPGFIDLHVHGTTPVEQQYQLHDGVTTALDLEFGYEPIKKFIKQRTDSSLINFGASANHQRLRRRAMKDFVNDANSKERIDYYNNKALDLDEMRKMNELLRSEINDGALGLGVSVGYYLGASRREIYEVYKLASELHVPIFSHLRDGKGLSIQQAIADAMTTGASLHIVHINSTSNEEIDLTLEMVGNAQKKGFDITTEAYPYPAGSTGINTAIFREGWQERLGISYGDLQWSETGERLTKETFEAYQKKGGTVIIYSMKPEWIREAIKSPLTIIASDGMTYAKFAHPRTAGTFSRVLGKYVREEKALTLTQAIDKMTLMPARRLEAFAPVMKKKGRIQEGCDADITVFDPTTIIDKATFEGGLKFSEGIQYVVVNGTLMIDNTKTVPYTFPGKPILSTVNK